ncbi:MAG: endonuclease/exonuclease/phosphatase family protein [Sphingobacteriia bacterium]|nr:endonuclease/exonuclease/phosphatase family protein [Sphingobacteriia bacterium]
MQETIKYDSTILSDHEPQFFTTQKFGTILTWNILYKCDLIVRENHRYYNNGFAYIEGEEEYIARLERITQKIYDFITEKHDLSILALQELPLNLNHMVFFNETLNNYMHKIEAKVFNACLNYFDVVSDNMIICDANRLYVESNATLKKSFQNIVKNQASRGQFYTFTNSHNEKLDFINIHLKWYEPYSYNYDENIKNLLSFIDNYKQNNVEGRDLIITGDFNFDLNALEYPDIEIHAAINTTVVYVNDQGTQELQTNDGFIYLNNPGKIIK